MPLGLGLGITKLKSLVSGLRVRFQGNATITAALDGILRDLSADFVSNGTVTAALEAIKLLDVDFSGDGTITADLASFEGVFDTYSGGLFGISSRLLRADYAGDDITVRRSSDNATDDIGFVDNLIDSSSLSTFIGANSGLVTDAYDQTANSNNASQSTAANQPTIINSGTLQTINSIAAYDFDGANDNLLVWQNTTAPTEFQSLGSDLTIIARINANSITNTQGNFPAYNIACIRQNDPTTNAPFYFGIDDSKVEIAIAASDTFEQFQSTANLSTGTNYYLGVTITGTTLKIFINGALDSTHTISSATGTRSVGTTNSSFLIGARNNDGGTTEANYFDGKLNEILLFESALSDSNVISIMNDSTL